MLYQLSYARVAANLPSGQGKTKRVGRSPRPLKKERGTGLPRPVPR